MFLAAKLVADIKHFLLPPFCRLFEDRRFRSEISVPVPSSALVLFTHHGSYLFRLNARACLIFGSAVPNEPIRERILPVKLELNLGPKEEVMPEER